jgi:sucrose-6-phosphate hydrolase SacC (GH32 family)
MSNWDYATIVPTSVWRSAATVPRELSLTRNGNDFTLISRPVRELVSLQGKSYRPFKVPQKFEGEIEIVSDSINLMQSELVFDFNLIESLTDSVSIFIENDLKERLIIGYSIKHKQIFVDRTKAGKSDFSGRFAGITSAPYEAGDRLKLRIFLDASSAELFVDEGKLVMTNLVFPSESYTKLKVFSTSEVTLENSVFYSVSSIWQ